jgi:hypothetical protein
MKLLAIAAIAEAATGLALLVVPSLVGQLLLGAELSGVSVALARVAGIALFSLGLACWPANEATRPALLAMLTYNLLATLYLLYLGIRGNWVGLLLWPAVVLHGTVTLSLAIAWSRRGRPRFG